MFHNRYNKIVLPFFFIFDLSIVIIYFSAFIFVYESSAFKLNSLLLVVFVWSSLSFYFKSFSAPRSSSFFYALRPMFFTNLSFIVVFIFLIGFNLIHFKNNESSSILTFGLFVTLMTISYLRFSLIRKFRSKGKNYRNALLFGKLKPEKLKKIYEDSRFFGYNFIETSSGPILSIKSLKKKINDCHVDIVFLIEINSKIIDRINAICDDNGIRLIVLLPFSSSASSKASFDNIGGFSIIHIRHEPLLYLQNRIIKRAFDIFFASLFIVTILSWLPIFVKVIQFITYPGPLFFVQRRVGRDGNIFNIYKFRTMKISNEIKDAKKGISKKTIKGDNRISKFGRLLRMTNLDEMPQFFNVLLGTMSTVGPRPHMIGEDNNLEKNISKYRVRRFVKPGITGWAAIKGFRGGTDNLDLMEKRTKLDIWYLENWSLWLDIKIVALTILQMITFKIPKAY